MAKKAAAKKKPIWVCPVCGFKAYTEAEKNRHMEETKNDPAHQAAHPAHEHGHTH